MFSVWRETASACGPTRSPDIPQNHRLCRPPWIYLWIPWKPLRNPPVVSSFLGSLGESLDQIPDSGRDLSRPSPGPRPGSLRTYPWTQAWNPPDLPLDPDLDPPYPPLDAPLTESATRSQKAPPNPSGQRQRAQSVGSWYPPR